MGNLKLIAAIVLSGLLWGPLLSCNSEGSQKQEKTAEPAAEPAAPKVRVPSFDADSAYVLVARQVSMGPRTPGSAAQRLCASWMKGRLKTVCDTVYSQDVRVTGGDGKSLPCINLVGVINPAARNRILLLTHWDSRPWADQDTKDMDKPVMAADDAGSGVAVLMEVARQLKLHGLNPAEGVDILLEDVEDYGRSQWGEDSYCLGTQYWAKHTHVPGYKADFGILLDMVGARGAQFPLEGFSTAYAGDVQQKVWQAAGRAGFSSYFPFVAAVDITDDHLAVNKIAGIKTVDIINLTPDQEKPFAAHWHTHADDMPIIDKGTLKAVGQTLLQVLYEQAAQNGHMISK